MRPRKSLISRDRFVFDAARDAIFVTDVNTGVIVDANRAAVSLCGWSIAELRSFNHSKLYPPEIVEQALSGFDCESHTAGAREGLLQHRDGRQIPVEITISHFTDPNGRRLLICTFRDCTPHDSSRQELWRSDERFRQFLETSGDALRQSEKISKAIGESIDYGVWISTPDGRCIHVSESFLKLVGLTAEQCANFGWIDVLHPDDAEQTMLAWKECVRTEGRWEVEHRYRGVDGEWHPVLSRGVPVRDEDGRITCWVGINLDISTLKRTEERLRESESQARTRAAQLQATMDAVPAAIFVAHDPDFRHISGNQMAQVLLRQQPGSNFSMTASDGDPQRNFRIMRDGIELPFRELPLRYAMETGRSVRNCEMEVVFEDGESIHFLGNAEPMLDENGRPRGAVAVLSDITERKQAEAALREREDRFRHMADTAPVMFWASDPDNVGTFFNTRWLDFTGRTMEQTLGDGWTSNVHPGDLDQSLAACADAFHARRSFQIEFRLRRADGEYRQVLDSGVPRYRDGEFTGFIGSCIDVTEQKLNEERLRASEALLKDAQRLATIGSWEADLESGKIRWSEEMFRIFGLPNGAQPDLSDFPGYVHPKDRQIVLRIRDQMASSTVPLHAEFRIVRPDGEVRFVRTILETVRNDQSAPMRFLGATQDITDQVNATELLRESEKRLRNAERIAQMGNWRWEIKTGRIFWSQGLYRIFGTTPNWIPNYERFIQMVVPQDRDCVDQWVEDCLSGKRDNSHEFQIARPNGDLRTVACINEVSRDEMGSPIHMYGTCQDVTDSRRTQREVFAKQKLESLGTLASGIAHDFNNLLGAVLAQAELALSELVEGSRPEAEIHRIRDAAHRGAEIVNQLMIYSGKESEVREFVDVSRTVQQMLDLLRVSVSKNVVLQTDLEKDLLPVRGNAAHLRRIVMNLVTNASEAMRDRVGPVRVSTRRVAIDYGEAITRGLTEGDHLQLEVSDTGDGMHAETLGKIFDPFFTTKSSGRGFGLAVVHAIVRDLHGRINVSSEVGKGTTVQIFLPFDNSAGTMAPRLPLAEEAALPIADATVLVVEDEDILRGAVAKMLRKRGFDVLEAANGSDAIELLRTNDRKIDAILLDMTIPGRSSQDVIDEASQISPDLKVILTSAYSEQTATATLRAPAIKRFIRKPFQLDTLVAALQKVLSS